MCTVSPWFAVLGGKLIGLRLAATAEGVILNEPRRVSCDQGRYSRTEAPMNKRQTVLLLVVQIMVLKG